MFRKDEEMFTERGNLNMGFYVIVAAVTDSVFTVFLGRNVMSPASKGNCGVIN